MDVKLPDAMAVVGKNLVMYDRSCFDRDSALNAWNRRREVLSQWCGILM